MSDQTILFLTGLDYLGLDMWARWLSRPWIWRNRFSDRLVRTGSESPRTAASSSCCSKLSSKDFLARKTCLEGLIPFSWYQKSLSSCPLFAGRVLRLLKMFFNRWTRLDGCWGWLGRSSKYSDLEFGQSARLGN